LFTLDEEVQESAIWALACAVPHSDILHTYDGSPENEARQILAPSLCWTVDEVIDLLGFVDNEQGMTRGSFGQHIYHLLVMDPAFAKKTAKAAIKAARGGDETAAVWALVLAVYWASEDGDAEYGRLLAAEPSLAETWIAEQIEWSLQECGYVTIF
jgi:hypothetical protein